MAYRNSPSHSQTERDEAYPSESASRRAKLMTRNFCNQDMEPDAVEDTESRCARFNRQLREGHAGRNSGDE